MNKTSCSVNRMSTVSNRIDQKAHPPHAAQLPHWAQVLTKPTDRIRVLFGRPVVTERTAPDGLMDAAGDQARVA
jgi:hypothetical protein